MAGRRGAGGGSVTTPIILPNTDTVRTYDLDGLGNWQNTVFTPEGGSSTTELRRHNYLNQITAFQDGGSPRVPVLYDHGNNAADPDPLVQVQGNGNIADDGTRLYAYDAMNRLTTVTKKSGSVLLANYVYDAMGRRIQKIVFNGGISGSVPDGTTNFIYLAWQCVEERNGSDNPTKQYVWGIYLDELTQMKTYITTGPQSLAAGGLLPSPGPSLSYDCPDRPIRRNCRSL